MAGADVDIAQLTEDQQLALQQYTSVTDQDFNAAVSLLQRCEWNVQIAIARFFDGEPAEPIAEIPPDLPPPPSSRRQETLANGFSAARRSPGRNLEPAPRVVSTPENQINQQPPLLLSLLLTPANLMYALFSRLFGILSRIFPFIPRLLSRFVSRPGTSRRPFTSSRRPLGPQDTTSRFLREFEEEYGTHTLPFLDTSYARAFDVAKRDLKFLLVIPISPEHDDTTPFIKSVLLSGPVTAFLNDPTNNLLLWGGSVQDSEAYQVAAALNTTTFPYAALITHTPSVSPSAMSVIARIAGPTTPAHFTATLQAAIAQHSGALTSARARRAEQQAERDLRDQQNSAYERSLAQDRERVRQRREAEAAREREEREERERVEREERYTRNLERWRRWRAGRVGAEPEKEDREAVRISLRLLGGERVMRRFAGPAEVEEVYAFVECFDLVTAREQGGEGQVLDEKVPEAPPEGFEHVYGFRLVSPMPREVYGLEKGGTVRERIGRSGNLIVERIEEEDELQGQENGEEDV